MRLRIPRKSSSAHELYEVNMKPPHDPQDERLNNIPELIGHLWSLYSAMTLDPALVCSAEHIREAALELEKVRRAAWEVYREEEDAPPMPVQAPSKKTRKKKTEQDAEWLKSLRPASPLKQ
jgi:hypothetical protein